MSDVEKRRSALVACSLKSLPEVFKSCQVIASYKSNLLRKADFVLKSGYQVTAFFIPFELDTLLLS